MTELPLDAAGRRRSPTTRPQFHAGRPPRNKGMRYPADPPTIEEIVAVMSRALGVEWETVVRDGIAELAGVPADVRRLFSRRRAEIEAALARRGVNGPRAAEVAALGTRRAKRRGGERRDLRPDWRRRAAQLDWRMADLDQVIGRADRSPGRPRSVGCSTLPSAP